MFFRPAATGAAVAYDALRPVFQSAEDLWKAAPQSVRNVEGGFDKFKAEHERLRANTIKMLFGIAGAGATLYMMAMMMADDDEAGRNKVAVDDKTLWTRNLRLPVKFLGKDRVLQVPWGFGLGAFGAFGAQTAALAAGHQKFEDFASNIMSIALDTYIPLPVSRISPADNPGAWIVDSVLPSIMRPPVEFLMNTDSLGREVYNNRMTRYGDPYTGGQNTPEMYVDAVRWLNKITNGEVQVQPNSMYFWANNYLDGVTKLAQNTYGLDLYASGKKGFDPKTDLPLLTSFIGKKSNYDGRQFAQIERDILRKQQTLNMFENQPDQYRRYIERHPNDRYIVWYYEQNVNKLLKKIRANKNKVQADPNINYQVRIDYVEQCKLAENVIKRGMIDRFKQLGMEP